jgi:hypothetical protein
MERYGDEILATSPSSEAVRRAWLQKAVGFSPELAPRALDVADEVRRVLGVDREILLYRAAEDESLACIVRTRGGPLHVQVHDVFLAHPDDAVLKVVIGHEVGHYLAHAPDRLRGPDPFLVYHWFARGRRAGVREVAAAFCRAAELTADRVALLASRDLDAALRMLMVLASGDPESARAGGERAYLADCRARVEQILGRRQLGAGDTHPENDVRAYALSLFAESDTYRALTGQGSGERSLAEIDRVLERLVGPSESADDEGIPDIPPSLVEQAEEKLGVAKQRMSTALRAGLSRLSRGAGEVAEMLRGGGAARGEEEAALPPDSGERDLEERFAALERELGAPPEDDDLERRFAELERTLEID